jgi:hypothetical protein
MINYVIFDNSDSIQKKFRHNFNFGTGLKLPTGKYFKLGFDELNMLPGSGSWDYLLNLNYYLQFKSFGFQNESSFSIRTENKYSYQFGNAFSNSNLVFYKWEINKIFKIVPQIGFNFNYNWKDRKGGIIENNSFNGGKLFSSQINLNFFYKTWNFGAQVFVPISQNLNDGYVTQKCSFRVNVNYFINKKTKKNEK